MREYEVVINGLTHTMRLDDNDAKRLNAKPVEVKPKQAANKSRSARNK